MVDPNFALPVRDLINEIVPGLYLGSVRAADDPANLEALGITHIMSLGVKPVRLPSTLV